MFLLLLLARESTDGRSEVEVKNGPNWVYGGENRLPTLLLSLRFVLSPPSEPLRRRSGIVGSRGRRRLDIRCITVQALYTIDLTAFTRCIHTKPPYFPRTLLATLFLRPSRNSATRVPPSHTIINQACRLAAGLIVTRHMSHAYASLMCKIRALHAKCHSFRIRI